MTNFIAVSFLLSGIFGIVSEYYSKSFAYSIDLNVALPIYALLIYVGVGLWRRKEKARTLALGLTLAGSYAWLVLLVYVAINFRDVAGGIAGSIALALYARMPQVAIGIPVVLGVCAVVLILSSILSHWFHRYLQRPYVMDEFHKGATVVLAPRQAIYGIAIAYIALTFFHEKALSIPQSALPGFAQSAAYKDVMKRKAVEDSVERAKFLDSFVGQSQFSADGSSLVIATNASFPELFFIDVAKGTVVRKDPKIYSIMGGGEPDRLSASISQDHRFLLTRKGLVDTQTDQIRALALPKERMIPIGFGKDAATYVWFTPDTGKITGIDVAADRVMYSTDATKAEWLADKFKKDELEYAFRTGRLSPLLSHFVYIFKDHLHLLNIADGTLEIDARPIGNATQPYFAKEGDAVIVTVNGASGQPAVPSIVYMLANKSVLPHSIRPPVFYFSTVEDRIVSGDSNVGIAEYSVHDLETPRRKIQLARGVYVLAPDGSTLLFKDRARLEMQYADLLLSRDADPTFSTLPTKLVNAANLNVHFATGKNHVAIFSGPRVEFVATATLGQDATRSQILDLSTLSQDSRLANPGKRP